MIHKSMKQSGAVGAIVFAVGFLANLLVFTRNFGTAEEVATYLDENRLLIFLGAVSVGVAGLGFLWFLAQLRVMLAIHDGTPGGLSTLSFGAGILFVGLWWVAMPVDVGIAATVGSGLDHPVYQALRDVAHWHIAYSQLALATALLAIYLTSRRTDVFPRWMSRFTAIVTVTSLLYIVATPIVLLVPVWAIAMAIAMLRVDEQAVETG